MAHSSQSRIVNGQCSGSMFKDCSRIFLFFVKSHKTSVSRTLWAHVSLIIVICLCFVGFKLLGDHVIEVSERVVYLVCG